MANIEINRIYNILEQVPKRHSELDSESPEVLTIRGLRVKPAMTLFVVIASVFSLQGLQDVAPMV